MKETLTIVVMGNPIDGFRFYGPWEVREDAEAWGEGAEDDWWLFDLIPAYEEDT